MNQVIYYAKKIFKVRLAALPELSIPPILDSTLSHPPLALSPTPTPALPRPPLNLSLNPIPLVLISFRQFWKKYQANQNKPQGGGNQYNGQQQQYGNNQAPYPPAQQQGGGGAWNQGQGGYQQTHSTGGGGYGAHDGPATVSFAIACAGTRLEGRSG